MLNSNSGYSLADIAAATGNGNNAFGSDGAWWIIVLFLFALGGWGNGNNGGFGGGNPGGAYYNGFSGVDNGYAWLSNGQKEIMQNTNNGFSSLHLSNQIEGVRDGINNISTQLCGSTADIVSAINGGFSNAEISANARQIADMNQNFNNQIATLQGFNGLQGQLAQCCCDNRLATCQTQNIIQNESNATRFADANNTRDIITNATSNTQAILDKLCQLELDGVKAQVEAKNDRIAELQTQLNMANLAASQTAQNAFIAQGFANEVDQLYNRLNTCPVPTTPVYGRTPIFTCPNNGWNNGCGCNAGF